MNEKIEIMQHNLKMIKDLLGWRTVDLASRLGCTRQLINYLENGHHKMSQIQYMAIMYLLQTERDAGNITDKQWIFIDDYLLQIKMKKKN